MSWFRRARGGRIPKRPSDDSVPIMLSRGLAVMPQAQIDRYGDALTKVFPDTDIISAEEALEAEDQEGGDG